MGYAQVLSSFHSHSILFRLQRTEYLVIIEIPTGNIIIYNTLCVLTTLDQEPVEVYNYIMKVIYTNQ